VDDTGVDDHSYFDEEESTVMVDGPAPFFFSSFFLTAFSFSFFLASFLALLASRSCFFAAFRASFSSFLSA